MTWGIFKSDSVSEAYEKMKAEELKGNQHKIDANDNGKVDAHDFKLLRAKKKTTEVKEDVEELEELSKTTLGSYVKKASNDMANKGASLGKKQADADEVDRYTNRHMTGQSDARETMRKAVGAGQDDINKVRSSAIQRNKGIGKAVDRLTKEAVEELEELSKTTLKSYVKGAKSEVDDAEGVRDSARAAGDGKTANDMYQFSKKRNAGITQAKAKLTKEETDLLEYEAKDGVYKHQAKAGRYGGSEKESDYVKGPSNSALKKIEAEKKKKKNEGLDLFSERELDMLISEVLSKNASAGTWISDFIKSDAPQFSGKSQEQRKNMALGAYYAAQKKESTDYESFIGLDEVVQGEVVKTGAKEIKHANMKDKQDDQEVMEPRNGTEASYVDAHSIRVTDDPTQGKYDAGTGKLGKASEPTGKGPATYNAKEKLGIKEAIVKTAAGEEIDTEPTEASDREEKAKKKFNGVRKAASC